MTADPQPETRLRHVTRALVLACVGLGFGCTQRPELQHESFLAMGSYVEVSVAAPPSDALAMVLQQVRDEVSRLESILSDYDDDSNVGQLNTRRTSHLQPETRLLLQRAQEVCRETGGAFDVSLGPVKALWGFGDERTPRVPPAADIEALLAHVGCDVYRIEADGTLQWNDAAARIDLGGIAQGLVAQRTAELLERGGFADYLINISGDIVVGGKRPDGRDWRIGVQHPRNTDSLLARLSASMPALTTSGDYEQVFWENGQRYHHIFDPTNGRPVRHSASVSVFCSDGIDADCYATAVFVLGPEAGMRLLESKPELEGLITWEDETGNLQVRATSGLQVEWVSSTRP